MANPCSLAAYSSVIDGSLLMSAVMLGLKAEFVAVDSVVESGFSSLPRLFTRSPRSAEKPAIPLTATVAGFVTLPAAIAVLRKSGGGGTTGVGVTGAMTAADTAAAATAAAAAAGGH